MIARSQGACRSVLWVPIFTGCRGVRTRHLRNPIRFPSAIVVGKSLLPMNVIVVDLSPQYSGFYRLTVVNIFPKEFTLRTVKAADHSRIQLAGPAADVVSRPLPFFQTGTARCRRITFH